MFGFIPLLKIKEALPLQGNFTLPGPLVHVSTAGNNPPPPLEDPLTGTFYGPGNHLWEGLRFTRRWLGAGCNTTRNHQIRLFQIVLHGFSSCSYHPSTSKHTQTRNVGTASAASMFTPHLVAVSFQNCHTTITGQSELLTSPRGPSVQCRQDNWEGQLRGTVPVKFLPPALTRNSSSENAP